MIAHGGFQKGREKTGGREKGTPNKIKHEIREIFEANNINLIEEFIENLKHYPHNPIAQNTHILKMMEFIYPKYKEHTHEISIEMAIEVLRNEFKQRGIEFPIKSGGETLPAITQESQSR